MGPLTPAIGAALCLSGNALANTDVYQATITGTFTEVDFDSVDPGALVDLGAGDSYALTITTEITGDVARAPGIASYDILSVELAIFDGSGMTYVTPLALSALRVEIGAAYSFLGFAQGVSASPFDSARLSLLDSDGDPILGDTALPLSLDLDAFDEQREFSLFGVLDTEDQSLYPSAYATIDSFSAKIIPAPAAAAGLMLPVALAARRRRPTRGSA